MSHQQQPIEKVLHDYVVENANLKITIEILNDKIKQLEEKEVSECSENSEPKE